MSKNQPGTVEKKSSTIGPPAEIEPTPVSYLRSSVVIALHRHRKGVGSIPARGPVVDEFFSTVSGWFFDMCMIPLELKTHLPFTF